MKRTLILAVLTIFLVSPLGAATIYKWVDEKGVTNFSDDPEKIPPAYRDRALRQQMEEPQEASSPSPAQQPAQQVEERATDIRGRGEVWWRERARPLKEKLKEATENYEKANSEYTKKADQIGKTNFYGRSRSQTKWDAMELNRLNEEKKKCEALVAEANEKLKELRGEAEEAKANPEWLE